MSKTLSIERLARIFGQARLARCWPWSEIASVMAEMRKKSGSGRVNLWSNFFIMPALLWPRISAAMCKKQFPWLIAPAIGCDSWRAKTRRLTACFLDLKYSGWEVHLSHRFSSLQARLALLHGKGLCLNRKRERKCRLVNTRCLNFEPLKCLQTKNRG